MRRACTVCSWRAREEKLKTKRRRERRGDMAAGRRRVGDWAPRSGINPGAVARLVTNDEGGYLSDLECDLPTTSNANRKRPVVMYSSDEDETEPARGTSQPHSVVASKKQLNIGIDCTPNRCRRSEAAFRKDVLVERGSHNRGCETALSRQLQNRSSQGGQEGRYMIVRSESASPRQSELATPISQGGHMSRYDLARSAPVLSIQGNSNRSRVREMAPLRQLQTITRTGQGGRSSTYENSESVSPRSNGSQGRDLEPRGLMTPTSQGSPELSESSINEDPLGSDIEELVPDRGHAENQDNSVVVSTLNGISETLTHLVKRVHSSENELKMVKQRLNSSSSSIRSVSKKIDVPLVVRSETRKMYQTLVDDENGFAGFSINQGVTFKDAANEEVVRKLVKEVQGVNPTFLACHIRNAAYTYYKTLCQEESLRRRGKLTDRKRIRRRRERVARKLQARLAIFTKRPYQPKDREKWSKALVLDLMSSEESEEESDSIIVRPLPWRSSRVDTFFQGLDEKAASGKSPQSLRQMKRRILGDFSERSIPKCDLPPWALK